MANKNKKGRLASILKRSQKANKAQQEDPAITEQVANITAATRASKNASKKSSEPIHPSFYHYDKKEDFQNLLFIIDVDKGPVSLAEVARIKQIIEAGGHVAFETKRERDKAIEFMRQLHLDITIEDGKILYNSMYLICDNGGAIIKTTNGTFDKEQGDIFGEIPVRKASVDSKGNRQKLLDRHFIMDTPTLPKTVPDQEGKGQVWEPEVWGGIEKYVDDHQSAGITFDPYTQQIVIKGGTREEQLIHARDILKASNLLSFEVKHGEYTPTTKEIEDYGISYTDEGIVIRPLYQSMLNAERSLTHVLGLNISDDCIRKQISSIHQIINNVPAAEFMDMWPSKKEDGTDYTDEELKKDGVLQEIGDKLINIDPDAITVDPKTRNGTYVAPFRFLSNRKALRTLHRDYERYQIRLNQEIEKDRVNVIDPDKVNDAMITSMMPAYDMPELNKVPYLTPYSVYQKAVETKKYDIVKKFEDQMVWQQNTTNNVMHFMLNIPPNFSGIPQKKGKVSSFLYNVIGKEVLPQPVVEGKQEFLDSRKEALTQIENISASLIKIEDPAKRAEESAIFSGFMLELEYNIKKGYTQQEIFDKIIQFVNERDYIIAEAPAQQAEEPQDDDTLTPPSSAPKPPTEEETHLEDEATDDDTAENEDAAGRGLGDKGGTSGGSPVVEKEKKDTDYDQAYINQEILRQSLAANKALASNLVAQYQERRKKGEYADDSAMLKAFTDDPVRKYLASQKKIISDQLEDELKNNPTVEGEDEHVTVNAKQISVAAYYSAINTATNMCNDFITKQAEINGDEPMLLSAFVKSDIDKNPAYQQMQYQVVEGIDDVDLRVIKDPNVHNILDQTNKAFKGNVEVRDDVTEDPRFAMMADLTTAQIEAHNAQIEPIVKDIITREAEKETKAVIEETPEDEEKHKKEKTAKRTPIKKHPKKEVKEEDTATKEKDKKNVAKKTVKKKSKKPQPLYDTVRKQIKNSAKAPRVDNSFQQDGYKASGKNIDKKPTKDTKSTEIAEADEIMQMEACMTQRLQLTYLEMTTDANDVAKRSAIRQKINDLPPIPRSQIGTMVRILNYKDYKDKDLSPIERDIRERLAPLQEQVAKEREKIEEEKAKKAAEEAKTNEESDVKVLGE